MKPGDVILSRKVRSYQGAKILVPGQPEWTEFKAGDGEFLVLLCMGTVPKGAHPQAVERLHSLGYARQEGYPNPGRFNLVEFQDKCVEAVQLLVDRTGFACPHCDEKELVAGHIEFEGPQLNCGGCGVVHTLQPYEDAPNSTTYAMQVVHALAELATIVRAAHAEANDEHTS